MAWWARSAFGGDTKRLNSWLRRASGMRAGEARYLVELDGCHDWPSNEPPRWLQVQSEVFANEEWLALAEDPGQRQVLAAAMRLRGVFHPFVLWARPKAAQTLRRLGERGIEADEQRVLDSALNYLAGRLDLIARPSAVLAMNAARKTRRLDGQSSEERALEFAAQLLDQGKREHHLAAMPILDRRLAQVSAGFIDAFEELIDHLIEDWPRIRSQFGLGGKLLDVNLGLGDPHKGLRTVCALRFEGGRLIYKPRNMEVDAAFRDLTAWVNDRATLALPVLAVLDCGDHGWVEFIEARECGSISAARLGHRRMGGMLALLHLCGASDIHFENLIFDQANPYMVDLETLLTPFPRVLRAETSEWSHSKARHLSIMRVGFLPMLVQVSKAEDDEAVLFDPSGVGLRGDMRTAPLNMPILENSERDDAEMAMGSATMLAAQNHPRVAGEDLPAIDFIEELEAGFCEVYRTLMDEKASLAAIGGPLRRFSNVEIRWVPRSTLDYAKALQNMHHASSMRDGAEQDISAARVLFPIDEEPRLSKILRAELLDLWEGDVPYFKVRANSKSLRDSRGRSYRGYFAESGYEGMLRIVDQLSPEDMAAQQARIRMSLRAAKLSGGPAAAPEVPFDSVYPQEIADAALLEECVRIGDRLIRDALVADGAAYWLGMQAVGHENYVAELAQADLYFGSGGIGIFLGELYRATGLERFRSCAEKCLGAVRTNVVSGNVLGAFDGLGGRVYAQLRISRLIGQDLAVAEVESRLATIRGGIEADNYFDVISGAAGSALVALAAAQVPEISDLAIDTAVRCGRRLQETAEHSSETASWKCSTVDRQQLPGFAHGASGIAYALVALTSASGERAFAELAWRALRFVSTEPVAEEHDRSTLRAEHRIPLSWCHGSAGIALARLKIAELAVAGTPDLSGDIESNLDAVLRGGMGGSHCLCHGALGNAEALFRAGGRYARIARAGVNDVVKVARDEGRFRGGVAEFEEMPGLMLGTSGAALALLRAIDPSIPSVLLVEPPR